MDLKGAEKLSLDGSVPFNLDYTLGCGQVFRWRKIGEWWFGVIEDKVLKIRQDGNELIFENAEKNFVEYYFSLDVNLPRILSSISKDEHIRLAIQRFKGLRIVRQNPWECLISYMCATNKNIPAIKQNIEMLCQKFGKKKKFGGLEFHVFPTPAILAQASIRKLQECGLGFRAKYISDAAKRAVKGSISLESLREKSYEKTREELLRLRGVGNKVADCVSLFALGKLEAFPVDVWVKRAVLKHYGKYFEKSFVEKVLKKKGLSPNEYRTISMFGRKYFGKYAGYAQEYLFHYERLDGS